MSRKVFAVAFPLVTLAVLMSVVLGSSAARTQSEPRIVRQLPGHWVAFSANFSQSAPTYPRPDKGNFYRNSDGSERNEIYDGLAVGVTIKNIPEKTFYRRIGGPESHWSANPMILPPEGWHPETALREAANIVRLDESFEGMEVYRHTFSNGDVTSINAPDLNFFKVAATFPGGKWVRFSNIILGEPDPALFVPSPGAEIRRSSRPDGIIFSPDGPVR